MSASLSLTPAQLDEFARRHGVTFRPDGGVTVRRNGRAGSFGPASDVAAYWQQVLAHEFPAARRKPVQPTPLGSNLPRINEAPTSPTQENHPMSKLNERLLANPLASFGAIVTGSDQYRANSRRMNGVTLGSAETFAMRLNATNDDGKQLLPSGKPFVGDSRPTAGRIASRCNVVPVDGRTLVRGAESARAAAAAVTAWGTAAPETTIGFTRSTPDWVRIPTFLMVDIDVWDDQGDAQVVIDEALTRDVVRAVEDYALNAATTGAFNDSAVASFSKGSDTRFGAIVGAAAAVRASGFDSQITALVAPSDYKLLVMEHTSGVRAYDSGILADLDVKVVASSVVASGSALVGALSESLTIWNNVASIAATDSPAELARLTVSDSHGTAFKDGQVAVLCTARVQTAVERPSGLRIVTSF